jgi:hypothetical protein
MGLEQNTEQQYREHPDKFVDTAITYQMTTLDYVMRPTPAAANIIITLPPVAEAKGRWYSIIARNINGGSVTINDKCDSECWPGALLLSATCDRALLYSDGISWFAFVAALNEAYPS